MARRTAPLARLSAPVPAGADTFADFADGLAAAWQVAEFMQALQWSLDMRLATRTVAMLAAETKPYRATEQTARGAAHLAYLEGAARPRKRETAADRQARERAAWGFTGNASR